MQLTTVVLALAATAAAADSCAKSYSSKFAISVVKPQGTKRDVQKRAACNTGEGSLIMSLKDGVLTDGKDRTGYIASNFQFQFDAPPQADHLETSGFEVCGNNSLALNGNAVWYQCLSGDFYNLYNKNWAAQCKPVEIMAVACDGSASGSGSGSSGAGSSSTGSAAPAPAAASPTPSAAASQISDGQPQAPSASIAVGAGAVYGPQVLLAAAGLAAAAVL